MNERITMTSIAGSLQTEMARGIPIAASNSSYIHTTSRQASNVLNMSTSKSNNIQTNSISDSKNLNNSSSKTLCAKYRTMSSSPPSSTAEASDLFLSGSSHLIGYLPQYEAVSRNAQVSFTSNDYCGITSTPCLYQNSIFNYVFNGK